MADLYLDEEDEEAVHGEETRRMEGVSEPSGGGLFGTSSTAASGTRRWQLLADDVTTVQPSPLVAQSRSSLALRRKSSSAADRIRHHMETLGKVVTTPTSRAGLSGGAESLRTPATSYAAGSSLRGSRRRGAAPMTTPASRASIFEAQTPAASLSVMDDSGLMQDILVEPTPEVDRTMSIFPSVTPLHDLSPNVTLANRSVGERTLISESSRVDKVLLDLFHQCVSQCPGPDGVVELLGRLEESCREQVDELKETLPYTRSQSVTNSLLELSLERSTWQLASVLYADRLETQARGPDGEEEEMVVEESNKRLTDKQYIDAFFLNNPEVRQSQLVIDWLEENALANLNDYPTKARYFADTMNWENTIHDIRHGLNKGLIITQVDPDAPTRENKHLSDLDEKDDQSLVKHLFMCIRAGQLEKAYELCIQCGQPWRAATLEGWKLYHNPNLGKMAGDVLEPCEGNLTRDLWRVSCWELTKDPSYSVYEKAIYAALSGNLQQLLPACHSWYDQVWAHFRVMVDVLVEQKLQAVVRYPPHPFSCDMPQEYWNSSTVPQVIFQEIEASPLKVVSQQSKDRFHVTQKHLILDTLDALVDEMSFWLQQGSSLDLHRLRFMAHLAIVVQNLQVECDNDQCYAILEGFVQCLIRLQYTEYVALYTSYLPSEKQISCYALLLEGIYTRREQTQCLDLARKSGLDVAAITKHLVENIRMKDADDLPESATMELGDEVEITNADRQKVQVIDWMVYEESQRGEALYQANALMRMFIAKQKTRAAREVFEKVPADSVDVVRQQWIAKEGDRPLSARLENDLWEFICIGVYLDVLEAFNTWSHAYNSAPAPPADLDQSSAYTEQVAFEHRQQNYLVEKQRWEEQLQEYTEVIVVGIQDSILMAGEGWLVDPQPDEEESDSEESRRRKKQMAYLRRLCLPQLCFLLHKVLHSTGQYQKCLQLADIVASEQHCLYKEFYPHQLSQLLQLLRSSSLGVLDSVDSDPVGYAIA